MNWKHSSKPQAWSKKASLAGTIATVMLALVSSAQAAGDSGNGPAPKIDDCETHPEADGCQGEVIVVESCEVQFGKGSMAVYEADTGDFKYCATAPPTPPPTPPPLPPGTGDDCKDTPMGCGGNWTPPDDECADEDVACICDQEEEEVQEPEICALSCSECNTDDNQCLTDSETENVECIQGNTDKAADMCSRYGGLRIGFGRGYEDIASCIQGRTEGFPGLGAGSSSSSSSGWSIGANGGVKFSLGVVEVNAGVMSTLSGTMTTGTSSTVNYPPVPVDRSNFPDCLSEVGHAIDACKIMLTQCRSHVTENTGESCEESTSFSMPFATFNSTTSAFLVYGPAPEAATPSRVTFKRLPVKNLTRQSLRGKR